MANTWQQTGACQMGLLWEVPLSLHLPRNWEGAVVFDRWRHQPATAPPHRVGTPARLLTGLPTPAEGAGGFEAGVEAMLGTPIPG